MIMNRIIILDENTSNQIAAGEVVERPASIVKELVENSVDSGAGNIIIDISKGGISLIRVRDDGSGIHPDDVEMAFERHGTSKIRRADDLVSVMSMGFRGEALPSIASVSRLELDTRTVDAAKGVRIKIEGGNIKGKNESGRQPGTTVTVRDLFFNVPARYKFLKNDSTEARYCTDIVTRMALAHPDISFTYNVNRSEVLRTPGDGSLRNALYCAYGREIIENLYEVDYNDDICSIKGYTGNRFAARGNRRNQTVFVNGRYIKDPMISKAVEKAYETEIMKGKFPFYVLDLRIDPGLVDVNVHPAKTEVRFKKSSDIFNSFYSAVRTAVDASRGISAAEAGTARIRKTDPLKQKETIVNSTFFDKEPTGNKQGGIPDKVHGAFKEARKKFYSEKPNDEPKVMDSFLDYVSEPKHSVSGEYIDVLAKARIAGVLFDTFIILEYNREEMLVIDQHAAHERITFEGILKKRKERNIDTQKLMVPYRVKLDRRTAMIAEDNRELLESLGFEYDMIGINELVIRGMPVEIEGENTEEVFVAALDGIDDSSGQAPELVEREAIYQMACKNSVKANTKLNELEIKSLLRQLGTLENPYTCPHGRPVILTLTRKGLEKIFKRIV